MNVGVIARATDRGLGIQTMEAARNLDASVLVVDIVNSSSRVFPTDRGRFPDAPIVRCDAWRLPEREVRAWLQGLDAIYSAETFYDARLPDWARDAGVATVLHLNPEFVVRQHHEHAPRPSAWWSATTWRLKHLPPGTEVVPFPVAVDRWPTPAARHDGPCRWLHVAGKRAVGDRNGTDALLAALPLLEQPCTVTITCQDDERIRVPADLPPHVRVRLAPPVVDYWRLYDEHDALMMPRRYGGLCLPVQEAMGAGLAVVMTAISPNSDWPVHTIPTRAGKRVRMPAGPIEVATIAPSQIARAMDRYADPNVRTIDQVKAREWAVEHSWGAVRSTWLDRFAELRVAA